ncbi:MAG: hypothetical protein ACYS9X_11710, partial [Planctomycetota bacterium]
SSRRAAAAEEILSPIADERRDTRMDRIGRMSSEMLSAILCIPSFMNVTADTPRRGDREPSRSRTRNGSTALAGRNTKEDSGRGASVLLGALGDEWFCRDVGGRNLSG